MGYTIIVHKTNILHKTILYFKKIHIFSNLHSFYYSIKTIFLGYSHQTLRISAGKNKIISDCLIINPSRWNSNILSPTAINGVNILNLQFRAYLFPLRITENYLNPFQQKPFQLTDQFLKRKMIYGRNFAELKKMMRWLIFCRFRNAYCRLFICLNWKSKCFCA